MILNIKFHEILFISSRATLATKFLSHTHRHTDWLFPEIVKSCSGHPKTCKSIQNRKSKICTKPILSSIYIEESKKYKRNKEKIVCFSGQKLCPTIPEIRVCLHGWRPNCSLHKTVNQLRDRIAQNYALDEGTRFICKKNLFVKVLYEFNFVDIYSVIFCRLVLRKSAVSHSALEISFLDGDKDVFNKILEGQNNCNYSPLIIIIIIIIIIKHFLHLKRLDCYLVPNRTAPKRPHQNGSANSTKPCFMCIELTFHILLE